MIAFLRPNLYFRSKHLGYSSWLWVTGLFLGFGISSLLAYPPAPPATLYGMVRGEFGYPLGDGGTDLVLLADDVEVARTTIQDTGALNENYRLTLPLDLNPGAGTYRNGTVSESPTVIYAVFAERGSTRIPVVEVNAAVDDFVPSSGQVFRMDFILGEDSDQDGLPDSWERFQVSSVGGHEGEDPLTLLSRSGDFDGDELTDWAEYIAGTFALLIEDSLAFRIVGVGEDGRTSFEFFAVDGRAYTIEASNDAATWESVDFETSESAPQAVQVFRSTASQMETMHLNHSLPIPRKFYRLRVH